MKLQDLESLEEFCRMQPEISSLKDVVARLTAALEKGESDFYYAMAKYAAHRWEKDVRRRPEVNVYRAGMDKAWKTLEAYCLQRREEIDAAFYKNTSADLGHAIDEMNAQADREITEIDASENTADERKEVEGG